MEHDKLVAAARQALEDLFSDAEVPPSRTREDLELIIEEIESMINSMDDPS